MKPSMTVVAFASIAAMVAVTAPALRARDVKIRTDFSKTFDFVTPKTWSWYPERPGDVLMARTADDDSEVVKKRAEPVIFQSVAGELAKKGLKQVPSGGDLVVKYYVLITIGTDAQVIGQFLPAVTAWGLPPFAAATQSYKVIEQGSLVMDVWTPDKKPMWRGVAQAEMNRQKPQPEREKRVREAITDILKQFPPKPKK